MADYAHRTRPKGYCLKAWLYCFNEATEERAWAFETVRNSEWTSSASICSLEHLGDCLAKREHVRAQGIYDYLHMRACGQTCLGALDPSAREKWERISGKRITLRQMWRYDHTTHTTSATRINGKWIDFTGKEISK